MPPLEKVMYIEDDPDIREIATLALRDVGGLKVLVCESGQAALGNIDEFGPQLLLLDVMMPEMDGPATLEALRQQGSITAETAVAFMTAKVHPEELDRYRSLGVTHVVQKPFDPMRLADEVRAIWEQTND